MVNYVKELCKVNIHNAAISVIHDFQGFQNCLPCASVKSESAAVVVKLLLKYQDEYLCYRLLHLSS